MKTILQSAKTWLAVLLLIGAMTHARAVTYTVDPGASWQGFMNVFDIPQNSALGSYPPNLGPYQFGSPWGTADLIATFAGPVLTLRPNSIGDPDPYWYIGGGAPGAVGNKIMDANFYQQFDGTLAGQTVTFTGSVLANSLVGSVNAMGNGWTAVAFVKDFAPDFSSSVSQTVALTSGDFNVSLLTINDPARHVQFGFEVIGPDVWSTDNASFGNIQITAIPEPTVLALLVAGLAAVAARGRSGNIELN